MEIVISVICKSWSEFFWCKQTWHIKLVDNLTYINYKNYGHTINSVKIIYFIMWILTFAYDNIIIWSQHFLWGIMCGIPYALNPPSMNDTPSSLYHLAQMIHDFVTILISRPLNVISNLISRNHNWLKKKTLRFYLNLEGQFKGFFLH